MDFTNKPASESTSNQVGSSDNPFNTSLSAPLPPPEGYGSRPKGVKAKKILLSTIVALLLAALVAYGTYAYFENNRLNNDLAATKDQLSKNETKVAVLEAANKNDKDSLDGVLSPAPLTAQEQIQLSSGTYVCVVVGLSCDKSTKTVTKSVEADGSKPGFAIVKVSDATGGATNLYLKQAGKGGDWVVIYDGQNVPPQEIVDRFAIPEDF